MRAGVSEVLVTAMVTIAMVLAIIAAMRVLFPDPAIEGSHCPASLGEPAYSECVSAWPESHARRGGHRLATGIAAVFLATTGLLLLERGPRRLPGLRLPLAFSMAAGVAGAWALALLAGEGPHVGFAYLGAVGLFGLAAYLHGDRPRWWQHAAAVALGVIAFLAAVLVYLLFFYEWR